ncbi:hypothetical protein CPB85DRAFT_1217291 [Mucidula mucida]|nr:hypothetical protein CPB85DRAFT_1217291 [Mucidula mucida]
MSTQSVIQSVLHAGSLLLDSSSSNQSTVKHSLNDTLLQRLWRYCDHEQIPRKLDDKSNLDEIKLVTAEESLSVVVRAQTLLGIDEAEDNVPVIGTRDIAQLRALLAIVFKWGVDHLLPRVVVALPKVTSKAGPSRITALDTAGQDFKRLAGLLADTLALLFPNGPNSQLPQTLITTTLINRHLTDVLKPSIALGWLPKSLATDAIQPMDDVRPLILRLLSILPPSQAILSLGGVISSLPSPPYVRRFAGSLLTRQILRPHGIRGLCEAVFGDNEEAMGEENDLDRLEHTAKVLTAVPKEMDAKVYYSAIVPKILELLSSSSPEDKGTTPYKRPAAFAISRMLTTDAHDGAAKAIIIPLLKDPFHVISSRTTSFAAPDCLLILTMLITNTDPSPTLISTLLSPSVPALYSLQQYLEQKKASDPSVLERVRGLLQTWARVVETSECVGILWSIVVGGEQDGWHTDLEGNITRTTKSSVPEAERFALFTPQSRREAEDAGEFDPDANIMEVYPDPAQFVAFLKRVGRVDVVGEIFVRCLEAYRATRKEDDPLKTLLYLQLVMQMQTQLEGGLLGLKDPGHVLGFVKHALEDANRAKEPIKRADRSKTGLNVFKITPDQVDSDDEEGDSDDDMPDSERYDEMTETAVNLLLAILEANPSLSARSAPVLDEIFDLLDGASSSLKSLVREARMVMVARLASTSSSSTSEAHKDDTVETYQRALKLLQDPILPVRAHGLLLIRELKAPNEALVPAILEIFMEAIQDDESYIYLNGVQGLAGMVDKHGKEVLTRLVGEYAKGPDGVWDKADVDKRVRIGEALGIVIKRCGSALGVYIDLLVPHLMRMVSSKQLPTTLKTSAVGLLGECAGTYLLALGSYWDDLIGGMLDLLQVETSTAEEEDAAKGMDANPTKKDKFPPLRRAALHFMGLLVKETTRAVYDGENVFVMDAPSMRRAKLTLGYLATTDGDGIVKVMAREVNEALADLETALKEHISQ